MPRLPSSLSTSVAAERGKKKERMPPSQMSQLRTWAPSADTPEFGGKRGRRWSQSEAKAENLDQANPIPETWLPV